MKLLPLFLTAFFLPTPSPLLGQAVTATSVYIAPRTDGQAGTGTQSDPYDGSTEAKFDSLMKNFGPNLDIHLTAGTFLTYGEDAFTVQNGWTIEGAGEGSTIVQLVGHVSSKAKHLNIVGYASNVTIKNLTCDGNAQNTDWPTKHDAVGSVTILGSNVLIDHVETINCYGDAVDGQEQFSILVGGSDSSHVTTGCVIQNCLTHDYAPGSNYTNGPNMSCTTGAQVLDCVDDGSSHGFTFSQTVGGTIRGCTTTLLTGVGFYTDTGSVQGLTIEENALSAAGRPIQFNSGSAATDITIANNELKSPNANGGTTGILLSGQSGSNFDITGNVFSYLGTSGSGFILDIGGAFTDLTIEDNSSNVGLTGGGGVESTITATATLSNNNFNEPLAELTTPNGVPDSTTDSAVADSTTTTTTTTTSTTASSSPDPASNSTSTASAPAASPATPASAPASSASQESGIAQAIAQRFSRQGSSATAGYVDSLPDGSFKETAIASLVGDWTADQPSEVAGWISQLPEGQDRATAIQSFARALNQTDAAQATEVASVLDRWMKNRTNADADALANSSLPDDVKNSFLASPE